MTLRFIETGSFTSGGYKFSSNDETLVEQTVVDEYGEYLLKTFPKKFEKVDFNPPKEVPVKVEAETTPVTKSQAKRSEPKKTTRKPRTTRKTSKKPEES